MRRLLIPLALIVFASAWSAASVGPVPAVAEARTAAVRVLVAPDRSDWTYAPGDPVRFVVQVLADGHALPDLPVEVNLAPERQPAQTRSLRTPADGKLVLEAATLHEPGFLRCVVTATVDGETVRGLATAGFSPERLQPTQTDPEEFDAFWAAQKAELARIPLEPTVTLLPEASTEAVRVYHVSVRTAGNSSLPARVHGILCEPATPGTYPAILRVPGAGVRPYQGLRDLAAKGVVTLEIGIHGIPVNLPQMVYDQLRAGALEGYWTYNLTERDRYYYRRVILAALRANDFLTSRPSWNGRDLAVGGESQGGMLAIATAALDERVTALHAIVPAFCDLTGPLHGRAGGWPHLLEENRHRHPEMVDTLRYYDTVNFARRLKVPGYYAWGYNDEVCPPTSMFAMYQAINAPKSLLLALEMGHRTLPQVYERVDEWVLRQIGAMTPPR